MATEFGILGREMFMDYSINLKRLMCAGFVLGVLSVATVGCGDDSDDGGGTGGTSGTSGGTGGAGGTGSGGMGGSGGGGAGGMGGAGGAPATMMCGTATCMGATIQSRMLLPCCDAAHGNICGLSTSMTDPMECTGLGQMGTDNTTCPPILNALDMPAPLCCTPEGQCGYRSASLMGCIERSVYPVGFLSMMPTVVAMFPLQSVACGADDDAGM